MDFLRNQMRMNFLGNRQEQIQKTQGAKKKDFFFVFLGGFAWILSKIKRG